MGSHSRHALHRLPHKRKSTAESTQSGAPHLVQWMLGNSSRARPASEANTCPLTCPHCLADGKLGQPLGRAQQKALIAEIAELGVGELLLTGGEPLAHTDFVEIVSLLGGHGVRWSLNTALLPNKTQRAAIERHPPIFAAVSLDGPRELHDAFRGKSGCFDDALESMAYFRDLCGDVAAGTTVTARNVDSLGETFAIVLGSAATRWGLHLIVPEGRARNHRELMLSTSQIRELLQFAGDKRAYFPVTMADELGYCGLFEPLVRDEPFYCGAGKEQCVILPDGEVVPCTTFDRSASAGSVKTQRLADIWRDGFAELRDYQPKGKCIACEYAPACAGGCWLQRKHGEQCFKPTWQLSVKQIEKQMGRAAAMAVALGLSTSGAGVVEKNAEARRPISRLGHKAQKTPKMEILQQSIVRWYASRVGSPYAPSETQVLADLKRALPNDPGARYLQAFAQGGRFRWLHKRTREIRSALKTKQISLCLIGLAWRDMAEWSFDHSDPKKRNAQEKRAIRELMKTLQITAETWRQTVFASKLDPFLRRPKRYRRFFVTKAGPRPWHERILHVERIGKMAARKRGWTRPNVTASFVKQHRHATAMRLTLAKAPQNAITVLRGKQRLTLGTSIELFDVLLVATQTSIELTAPNLRLSVTLPAGELTHADVLRLAYEQNRSKMRLTAKSSRGGRMMRPVLPLLLPALRELEKEEAKKAKAGRANSWKLQRLRYWLTDAYLF